MCHMADDDALLARIRELSRMAQKFLAQNAAAAPKPLPRPQRPWAYRPPTTSGGGFHQAHAAWQAGSYRTRDRGIRAIEYDTPEVDE